MSKQVEFLDGVQRLALYGLKRSGTGFAQDVLRGLNYHRPELEICIIHPAAENLGGLPVTSSASLLAPPADGAMIILKPADAHYAIDDAAKGGIRRVWLVMNAASSTNIEHAASLGMEVVPGCPLLFIPGLAFPHNFHRALARLFGKL